MGKSVDLPDPLESVASQPLGNADDLLAQLAGEEVDRLLAEADAEGSREPMVREGEGGGEGVAPSAADLAAAVTAPPPAPETAIQDQLDALFSDVKTDYPSPEAEPAPAPPAPVGYDAPAADVAVAPIAPAPFSPVTSKLPDDIDANEVMAAILGDAGSIITAPTAAMSAEPQPVVTGTLSAPAAPSAPAAGLATAAAERAALMNPADELPGPGELALLTAPVEDHSPLPAYLKPLEWMNAPLDLLPTSLRDVIGQIAILTLVNAVAVLIYVFVFRSS